MKGIYADLMARADRRGIPTSALVELTYACNIDCLFCYNDRKLPGRRLSLADYRRVFAEMAGYGVLWLSLSGGEPLVHPEFWEILAAARERSFGVRLYSNGALVTSDVARRLAAAAVIQVEVSIHGATADTHDRLTQRPGSFERTMAGVAALGEHGVSVQLKCPVTSLNEGELRDIKALGERVGRHVAFDPMITPRDDGDLAPLSLRASPEGLRRLYALDGAGVPVLPLSREPGGTNCGTGRSTVAIDPVGNVLPCVQLRRPLGNLHDASFADIWERSPVVRQVRELAVAANAAVMDHPAASFIPFCLGLAEHLAGDPVKMYPQAAAVGEIRKAAFESTPKEP